MSSGWQSDINLCFPSSLEFPSLFMLLCLSLSLSRRFSLSLSYQTSVGERDAHEYHPLEQPNRGRWCQVHRRRAHGNCSPLFAIDRHRQGVLHHQKCEMCGGWVHLTPVTGAGNRTRNATPAQPTKETARTLLLRFSAYRAYLVFLTVINTDTPGFTQRHT